MYKRKNNHWVTDVLVFNLKGIFPGKLIFPHFYSFWTGHALLSIISKQSIFLSFKRLYKSGPRPITATHTLGSQIHAGSECDSAETWWLSRCIDMAVGISRICPLIQLGIVQFQKCCLLCLGNRMLNWPQEVVKLDPCSPSPIDEQEKRSSEISSADPLRRRLNLWLVLGDIYFLPSLPKPSPHASSCRSYTVPNHLTEINTKETWLVTVQTPLYFKPESDKNLLSWNHYCASWVVILNH